MQLNKPFKLQKFAQIVHSRNISQGMTALMGFNPDSNLDSNIDAMEDNLSSVKSGEVTTAIRDTTVQGKELKVTIGIVDGTIETSKLIFLMQPVKWPN